MQQYLPESISSNSRMDWPGFLARLKPIQAISGQGICRMPTSCSRQRLTTSQFMEGNVAAPASRAFWFSMHSITATKRRPLLSSGWVGFTKRASPRLKRAFSIIVLCGQRSCDPGRLQDRLPCSRELVEPSWRWVQFVGPLIRFQSFPGVDDVESRPLFGCFGQRPGERVNQFIDDSLLYAAIHLRLVHRVLQPLTQPKKALPARNGIVVAMNEHRNPLAVFQQRDRRHSAVLSERLRRVERVGWPGNTAKGPTGSNSHP